MAVGWLGYCLWREKEYKLYTHAGNGNASLGREDRGMRLLRMMQKVRPTRAAGATVEQALFEAGGLEPGV